MTPSRSLPLGRAAAATIGVGLLLAMILVLTREVAPAGSLSFWLENTGGVWFVAAFVSGWIAGRAVPGALSGFGTMLLALFLHESTSFVSGEGFAVEFTPRMRTAWVLASAVLGGGAGFLGGWSAEEREDRWVGASVVGGLVAAESVALFIDGPAHPALDSAMGAAQIFAGTGLLLAGTRGRARLPALMVFLGVSMIVVLVELTTGVITSAVRD